MSKLALSVTLDRDNVAWLKARAGAAGGGLSSILDEIVTRARQAGSGPARSVVGTVDIDPADPDLEGADAAVRTLFEASLARPLLVGERRDLRARHPSQKKRRG